jgi:hypothetical protein
VQVERHEPERLFLNVNIGPQGLGVSLADENGKVGSVGEAGQRDDLVDWSYALGRVALGSPLAQARLAQPRT